MHERMTATARAELADAIRSRYAAAEAKEKRKSLVRDLTSNILGEAAGNKIT